VRAAEVQRSMASLIEAEVVVFTQHFGYHIFPLRGTSLNYSNQSEPTWEQDSVRIVRQHWIAPETVKRGVEVFELQ